jgi:2'-5' RNA ligase
MRLFVAVRPPTEVLDALDVLPRAVDTAVRWTTREQWHVTLRFLGNVDDPVPIVDALRVAVAGMSPVPVTIGPRAGVLHRQIVYLPVGGLDALADAVVAATAAFGEPPPRRRFRGHVTLARTKGGIVDRAALDVEAVWTVGEIELIRSRLGGGPARYETLATIALSASV